MTRPFFVFEGGTIKWLVNLLDIDKKSEEPNTISDVIFSSVIDHVFAGIEIVSGHRSEPLTLYFIRLLEMFPFGKLDSAILTKIHEERMRW